MSTADNGGHARRPAILAVDDEPTVLAAVSRDLRREFGERYRIMRAGSGPEALELLGELRRRGDAVALMVADQRMPGMEGTDFLIKARQVFPDAKRALLTAYADTSAAIAAINEVSLDYYLLKPWDPPEEALFPVVEDLLQTWEGGAALSAAGVRVIGHRFSKETHDLRDFMARNRVPGRWLDVERDAEARELLTVAGVPEERLPVVLLEDGSVLERPTVLELAERLGVAGRPASDHYDLVIVGGGPAGLAAAVYGASEGLRTVMVESEAPGGQAGQSSRIENYLGFPSGLSGSDLARRATTQARRLGAELLTVSDATRLRVEGAGRIVELTGGTELSANSVLVSSGVSYNRMPAPGFEDFTGAGVYYGAALIEARSCKDQHVVVIGGANSAGQAAVFFSGYAQRVSMLVRADSLTKSMSHYLIEQIAALNNVRGPHRDAGDRGRGRGRPPQAARAARAAGRPDRGRRRVLRVHRRAAANRLAGRRRRPRRARLHPRRAGGARPRLVPDSRAARAGDERPRRVRGRRRAGPLDQAGGRRPSARARWPSR